MEIKKITKVALGCAMMTMALTGCSSESVKWMSGSKQLSGEIVTQNRNVRGFNHVCVNGSPSVYYSQGEKFSVVVEADKDIADNVKTYVKGNTLVVELENSKFGGFVFNGDGDPLKVYVTSPDLTGVMVNGSGDFVSDKRVDTDNMDIQLKGSGDIDIKSLICDNLTAVIVGSGDMDIKDADALETNFELVGSGDMDVNLKNTQRTNIVLKGSGDIDIYFNNCGAVKSNLTGSGDITLKGNVRSLDNNEIGSGDCDINSLKIDNKK